MSQFEEIVQREAQYLLNTYDRNPLALARGGVAPAPASPVTACATGSRATPTVGPGGAA